MTEKRESRPYIVPLEPTDEMIAEGSLELLQYGDDLDQVDQENAVRNIWIKMVLAFKVEQLK